VPVAAEKDIYNIDAKLSGQVAVNGSAKQIGDSVMKRMAQAHYELRLGRNMHVARAQVAATVDPVEGVWLQVGGETGSIARSSEFDANNESYRIHGITNSRKYAAVLLAGFVDLAIAGSRAT
jgi:hypothetical protein